MTRLDGFVGLSRAPVEEAGAGDIVAVAGPEGVEVGDTISAADATLGLTPIAIDAPTLSMEFMVNDSPFAGREGKFVTSRHLKARLEKERRINVGLRIEELPGEGHFKVSGRGELHLSVLIETMRREGFEVAVSRPEVINKEENGVTLEPAELLVLDIETSYQGPVFEALGRRSAKMQNMHAEGKLRLRLEYVIAARALIGFKSELLTLTRGTGILHHSFHGYIPRAGEIPIRANGVMIAKYPGLTTGYALYNLQDRAVMFQGPNVEVYPGMIVGQNSRDNDLIVNPCKAKHMSNMRSKSADEALSYLPGHESEQASSSRRCELVEVTLKHPPAKIYLAAQARQRDGKSLIDHPAFQLRGPGLILRRVRSTSSFGRCCLALLYGRRAATPPPDEVRRPCAFRDMWNGGLGPPTVIMGTVSDIVLTQARRFNSAQTESKAKNGRG